MLTSSYEYHLPDGLIATHPAHPRDHARLLVYNRTDCSITHARFDRLSEFLPTECAIIFNDTKVINARIFFLNKKSPAYLEFRQKQAKQDFFHQKRRTMK